MCEPDGDGFVAEGGFVVIEPSEGETPLRVHYADEVAGTEVFRRFVPDRLQYIGQLEKLYAVVPYATLPHVFAGRHVLHFVDNTWALAALVSGYATAIDSGLIVNAFHALNVGLRADVFYEYVRSAANIADLPSRGALRKLLRVLRRLGMGGAATRVRGVLPLIESWAAPATEWLQAAQLRPAPQVLSDPSDDEVSLVEEQPPKRRRGGVSWSGAARRRCKSEAR